MQRWSRAAIVLGAGALAVLVLGAVVALASSVHFKQGSPAFRDNGVTLTGSGTIVGLGNGDVTVNLTAQGNPTAVCTNPSGKNQPPGQNPASVTLTGTSSIPSSAIKNGNAPFSVTTNPPTSPVPGAPDCPNSSWTETITDVAFTSAHLTFAQGGSTVLTADCTFSSPTADGRVPAGNVTCTSS